MTSKGKGHPRIYNQGPELNSFFNLGSRWGGWSTPRPGRFTPGKDPITIVQKLGGPQGRSGRVWKLAHTGIRSADRTAPSALLHSIPTELCDQ